MTSSTSTKNELNPNHAARLSLGVGIPATILAVVLVPYLVVRSELPDRLATHFDLSGRPDGSSSVKGFLTVVLVTVILATAVCAFVAFSNREYSALVLSTVTFTVVFVAGLSAGVFAGTVLKQRGLEDWTEANSPWLSLATGFFVALPLGLVAIRLATHVAPPGNVKTTDLPTMDLAEGEQAVWTAKLHSTTLALLSLPLGLVGVLVAAGTAWILAVPALFTMTAILSVANVRVRVDRRGLQVNYGILPWPRTYIPVEKMDTATVIDVRPKQWGGWGYRGSLKVMRQAAVVLRAGPGIQLRLLNGSVFAVTIDKPEPGVALLNTQINRTRSCGS